MNENNNSDNKKDWKEFFDDNKDMPIDLKIRLDELLLKIYERRISHARSQ